jgi:sulfite reductase alpha subunit-like flavoprotein
VRLAEQTTLLPPDSPFYAALCLSLDLTDVPGGLNFSAGDNIAVYPRQSPEVVTRAAAAFNWSTRLDEDFMLSAPVDSDLVPPFPTPTSLRYALELFLKLEARPCFADLVQLASYASGPDHETLARLLEDASGTIAEAFLASCDWVSLFERLPSLASNTPTGELLALIPPQHPRFYSTSSAPHRAEDRLDLTVALHYFNDSDSGWRKGTCSGYLHRLRPGDSLQIRVIPVPAFRLPISNFAPVLAIASGSGIAPLRAFWQERQLRLREARQISSAKPKYGRMRSFEGVVADISDYSRYLGPFVLLVGARSSRETFYADELASAQEDGAISTVHYALSREPGTPKTYVQHLLAPGTPAAESVATMLQHPKATIYVCGDASMASEVEAALKALMGAAAWAGILASCRYHEDVFGLIKAG